MLALEVNKMLQTNQINMNLTQKLKDLESKILETRDKKENLEKRLKNEKKKFIKK